MVARRVPTVGLFGAQVGSSWHPTGDRAAVLKVAKGEKVNIATLMDSVTAVTRSGDDPGASGLEDSPPAPGTGPLPAPGA